MTKTTIDDKDIVFYGTFVLTDINHITALIRCNARGLLLPNGVAQVFEVHRHRTSDSIIELYRHTDLTVKEAHVATLCLLDDGWKLQLLTVEAVV